MEEEKKVLKHVCKFCSKSFSCGRSLGGHMRSHMINDISAQPDGTKLTKKKLPSLPNNYKTSNNGANYKKNWPIADHSSENHKKNWPIADHSSENHKKDWPIADHSSENNSNDVSSFADKSCKDCGKKEKNTNNKSLQEEQDSWASGNNQKQQLVMDSQSDNETTAAPNRRRRSKRKAIRHMGTINSSSLSFPNNNGASSSVSEIEQEQEELAMCLMMLSRDVGQFGCLSNSFAESSDNDSVFIETNNLVNFNCIETVKFESRKTEYSVSGISGKELIKNDKAKNSKLDYDDCEIELGRKNMSKKADLDSRKRKLADSIDAETCKNRRFECTTCNRVFHSYQALGGHRASHKKTKGCFASRIDSSENSIETEQKSPDPTEGSQQLITESIKKEISVENDHFATDYYEKKAETSYGVKKGHECPICLKVFPSGQALGGHKRSHLVGDKNNQTISIQEPILPIRDFLDLNLPAPVEEESNGVVGFNPWWIGSSHKHEPFVGLISN